MRLADRMTTLKHGNGRGIQRGFEERNSGLFQEKAKTLLSITMPVFEETRNP
jgi:hypothetical protein